jgi:type I restriction enzyme M protein
MPTNSQSLGSFLKSARDLMRKEKGLNGDLDWLPLITWNEETTRPDSSKGAGLFRYLRGLTNSNGDDRREVIATVFKGVDNRMKSGYLLRDVINKTGGIHFTSSEELHTLGALYESMLRKMRDAAGELQAPSQRLATLNL